MTTHPQNSPLSPEREREVNEVLLEKSGMAVEGWLLDTSGEMLWFLNFDAEGLTEDSDSYSPFTRSADSLRLVEEKLSPEQWRAYMKKLRDTVPFEQMFIIADSSTAAMAFALSAPVSVRAAALAEVVRDGA